MAKDPAFLFYPNDFESSTKFFSSEQVGIYIRLLITQHQYGHLSKDQMLFISKTYDSQVFEKFKKDGKGLFYNERLENEINKPKELSESEIDSIMWAGVEREKKNYLETGFVVDVGNALFEFLVLKGKINLAIEEKKKFYAMAQADLQESFSVQLSKAKTENIGTLREILKDIGTEKSERVKSDAKRIALLTYFNQ